MKALILAFTCLLLSGQKVHANSKEISHTIISEYARLRKIVADLQPDSEVAGYLKAKEYGDHKLLWRISDKKGDNELIRIYRDKGPKQQAFVVDYFFSDAIADGRRVTRRFVGPAETGWRNDTVDFDSGSYLGRQGSSNPFLDSRDLEILKNWEIRLFVN